MSKIRTLCVVAVAAAVSLEAASSALAQQPAIGERVRVKALSEGLGRPIEIVGTLEQRASAYLIVRPPGAAPARIAWDDVWRFQVSRGRHSNSGKGAMIGLGIGGALGLALGISLTGDDFFDVGAGDVALISLQMGAMGAGIGALIGMASKSERWETVPPHAWRIQVAPDPGGGVALGVRVRL